MVRAFFLSLLLCSLAASAAHACPDRGGLVDINCDGQVRVLTFGDSITAGVGDELRVGGWPTRVGQLLPGVVVVNVGISGERTYQGRGRAGRVFAQHFNPDYVVLLEGVNDYWLKISPTTTKHNLLAIMQAAQNTGAVVLLSTLTAVKRGFQKPWVNAVNAQIAGMNQINFFGLGEGIISSDLLHPDANGYSIMAQYVAPILQQQGNLRRPADTDADGIYDFAEIKFGSDMNNRDSDGDGLVDGDEVFNYGSSPILTDTDGDGLSDRYEAITLGSDPANPLPGAP